MQVPSQQNSTAARDALAASYFIEGRRAGLASLPSSLAPGQPGSLENTEWLKGWRSGVDQRHERDSARVQMVRRCRYTERGCDCGGRGLCVDVA